MTGASQPRIEIYKDALNSKSYICDAPHWSALTSSVRRVTELTYDVDWDVVSKKETNWYDNPATDLSTVQSLSFS
jgi:hypothetical protein